MKRGNSLLKSSFIFAIMTFLSRILGFIRDMVTASLLGSASDIFVYAQRIPNLFRRLFAEGSFSQAFTPILAKYHQDNDNQQMRALIASASGWLMLITLAITFIGVLGSGYITMAIANGWWQEYLVGTSTKFAKASFLLKITFPYLFFVSMVALCGAIFNVYNRIALFSITPAILNISLILCALFLPQYLGGDVNLALAIGVFVGGVVQLAVQIPLLFKLGVLVRPSLKITPGLSQMFRNMVPALIGASGSQINMLINTIVASLFVGGTLSWLYYAERLLELPLGVFGVAISTIMLPTLSRKVHIYRNNDTPENRAAFHRAMDWGISTISVVAFPAMVALILLGRYVIDLLFVHGNFNYYDLSQTNLALICYSFSVLPSMMVKTLSNGFFAHENTKTPMYVSLFTIGVNALLNIVALWFNFWMLALATSISSMLNALILYILLVRKGYYKFSKTTWLMFGRCFLAAVGLAFTFLYLPQSFTLWLQHGIWYKILTLLLYGVVGIGVYFAILFATGFRLRQLRYIEVPGAANSVTPTPEATEKENSADAESVAETANSNLSSVVTADDKPQTKSATAKAVATGSAIVGAAGAAVTAVTNALSNKAEKAKPAKSKKAKRKEAKLQQAKAAEQAKKAETFTQIKPEAEETTPNVETKAQVQITDSVQAETASEVVIDTKQLTTSLTANSTATEKSESVEPLATLVTSESQATKAKEVSNSAKDSEKKSAENSAVQVVAQEEVTTESEVLESSTATTTQVTESETSDLTAVEQRETSLAETATTAEVERQAESLQDKASAPESEDANVESVADSVITETAETQESKVSTEVTSVNSSNSGESAANAVTDPESISETKDLVASADSLDSPESEDSVKSVAAESASEYTPESDSKVAETTQADLAQSETVDTDSTATEKAPFTAKPKTILPPTVDFNVVTRNFAIIEKSSLADVKADQKPTEAKEQVALETANSAVEDDSAPEETVNETTANNVVDRKHQAEFIGLAKTKAPNLDLLIKLANNSDLAEDEVISSIKAQLQGNKATEPKVESETKSPVVADSQQTTDSEVVSELDSETKREQAKVADSETESKQVATVQAETGGTSEPRELAQEQEQANTKSATKAEADFSESNPALPSSAAPHPNLSSQQEADRKKSATKPSSLDTLDLSNAKVRPLTTQPSAITLQLPVFNPDEDLSPLGESLRSAKYRILTSTDTNTTEDEVYALASEYLVENNIEIPKISVDIESEEDLSSEDFAEFTLEQIEVTEEETPSFATNEIRQVAGLKNIPPEVLSAPDEVFTTIQENHKDADKRTEAASKVSLPSYAQRLTEEIQVQPRAPIVSYFNIVNKRTQKTVGKVKVTGAVHNSNAGTLPEVTEVNVNQQNLASPKLVYPQAEPLESKPELVAEQELFNELDEIDFDFSGLDNIAEDLTALESKDPHLNLYREEELEEDLVRIQTRPKESRMANVSFKERLLQHMQRFSQYPLTVDVEKIILDELWNLNLNERNSKLEADKGNNYPEVSVTINPVDLSGTKDSQVTVHTNNANLTASYNKVNTRL